MQTNRPFLLLILDGWGVQPPSSYNAITLAHTPHWEKLVKHSPYTEIQASGLEVGLPSGQMGNSEVGHLNLGAGRVVYQDLTRIDKSIADGDFFENPVFLTAFQKAKESNGSVHVFGLLSPGGIHSHDTHIQAFVELAAQQSIQKLYMHAFLDGRDTPPKSAEASIIALEKKFQQIGCGQIASITGRYYAMDRDNRWDRVQKAYDLLTLGETPFHFSSALDGLKAAYERGETDEFVQPTTLHAPSQNPIVIKDNDVVIYLNFRTDRARALSWAFTNPTFDGFLRQKTPKLADFVTLTRYASDIPSHIAYPPYSLKNGLGEYISSLGLQQFRIAETEKYAHVTFFFNGGIESPFEGEKRCLIPSPKVATYDLQPEMSAIEVTDRLIEAILSQQYPLLICNFANPDMLGHTGNIDAAKKAIELIDEGLGRIISALQSVNGQALITADHGNAEIMFDDTTQQPHTAHTTSLVPVVYYGSESHAFDPSYQGRLADIAATVLQIIGLPQPAEMTGRSLFANCG